MNKHIVEVVFKVCAHVRHGEEIRLSGSVPELGCNNPERSVPLVTSPSDFPWWYTKESLFLPGGSCVVHYRYCIFSGGKFSRWEDAVQTRQLVAPKTEQINTIVDRFGSISSGGGVSLSSPSREASLRDQSILSSDPFKARQFAAWGRRAEKDNIPGPTDGVVIVSYFLPIILHKQDGVWSATWDEENVLSLNLNMRVTWVGSVRHMGAAIPIEDEESVTAILAKMNCLPIFINQNMHYQFYDVFCKQNLWLPLHHIGDVYGPVSLSEISAKSQQDLWFTYSTVNRLFKDKVVEAYHQGDMVWVHGFHLMLLPSFLRRVLQLAKIGFFFHTPFPSSEIWKTLPKREDMLRGLLGADQVGFHLYEYARHFMTSCHRLLGHTAEMNANGMMTINVDGREVIVTCIHVGVDLDRVQRILDTPQVEAGMYAWKRKFPGKKIISGIDKLERLKGIPLKLRAIEAFVTENPQWLGKVVFVIIGLSAAERGSDYRQTVHDVHITVKRLNETFASSTSSGDADCLVYFEEKKESEMKLPQRLAFFGASDMLLCIAPRDGLNRIPLEFTLAKQRVSVLCLAHPEDNPLVGCPFQAPMILSEYISSARVMRGAFHANPWMIEEVKQAIKAGLEIDDTQRADRFRRNLEFSTRLTTTAWIMQVLEDLKSVEKTDDLVATQTFGFGTGFRVMGVRAGFQPLDVGALNKAFRLSRHRLILLDWGGTLTTSDEKGDKMRAYALAQGQATREAINDEIRSVLETLCADPRNDVFVVSGKDQHAVSDFFGSIPGLGLAAEHGCYYRLPRDGNSSSVTAKWQTILSSEIDQSWKEPTKKVMEIFTQRTHGTYIEQKGNAMIWQFRDADPEFGFIQSKELEEHLSMFLSGHSVEVLRGGGVSDGYIEVRPAGLSKGLFLLRALEIMKSLNKSPDFLLAIGDDSSDEPMFEEISRMLVAEGQELSSSGIFSVTVGKKPSVAQAYVDDPNAVLEVLSTLAKAAEREKRFYSTVDLPSQALAFGANAPRSPTNQRSSYVFSSTPNSFGLGSSRAISVGNMAKVGGGGNDNFLMRPDKKGDIGMAVQAAELEPAVEEKPAALPRRESMAHQTMSEYFHNIESHDDDQEDDGIFF